MFEIKKCNVCGENNWKEKFFNGFNKAYVMECKCGNQGWWLDRQTNIKDNKPICFQQIGKINNEQGA